NNSPTSAPCSPTTSLPRISASPSHLYPSAAAKAASPSPRKCATVTSPPRAAFYLLLPIRFLLARAIHPAKLLWPCTIPSTTSPLPLMAMKFTVRQKSNSTGAATALSMCRSEEHTSELQSRFDLVCRLLLEKKKKKTNYPNCTNNKYTCTHAHHQ